MIDSDVVVTNTREIYNDHISAHIMSLLLAFARGLQVYIPQQVAGVWQQGYPTIYLPEATAVIVGVGGIGGETARLCAEFGMTVLGVDPRLDEPTQGLAELHRPDALLEVLPRGDFVIVTVPETPETQGMFGAEQFRAMKSGGFFINIGRGATVILDDLVDALRAGEIGGAGLDVFQVEPLPAGHPLWSMPDVLITPHVAGNGPYLNSGAPSCSSTTANASTRGGSCVTWWTRLTGSETAGSGGVARRPRPYVRDATCIAALLRKAGQPLGLPLRLVLWGQRRCRWGGAGEACLAPTLGMPARLRRCSAKRGNH